MVTSACPRASRWANKRSRRLGVELADDVVEQQQRRRAALGGERVALGQQQRQERQALLALRPVGAQLAPVAQQREVVAVRAHGR